MNYDIDANISRLVADHPGLFPDGKMPDVFSSVSSGWYELVDRLCTDIVQLAGANTISVEQIKEKFGTLRFYWRMRDIGGDVRIDFLAPDDNQALPAGNGSSEETVERIGTLVSEAEHASATICETCGRPGRLLSVSGWLQTLCAEHAPKGAKDFPRTPR